MIEKLEAAINELIVKSQNATDSNNAMKFSQAVLSLMHALATVRGMKTSTGE